MADRNLNAASLIRRGALACVLLLLALCQAVAEDAKPLRGVALIIGNGEYEHLTRLPNPDGDASAIEDLFDGLGFETFDARDADARKLRRAIERFVEDAEGADVAVLYYAGHGIEAGGENYLVPTDADISALDDAGEKLVPLTALLADLRAAVPMTIILLDACRDNPFPPGAMVRAAPDAEPVSLSAGGLGETRSVARFGEKPKAADAPDADGFGTLIGFAAEPGRRALDGEPGGNSPYAAAVLRHISAMTGEEFGTVMRMVAEEVYLKTGGQQRPWVNESLRRLLYFGAAPAPAEGAEGDILRERRQLLLTISALPIADRRQVEQTAATRGVPMDALYGMLRALGQEIPNDPKKLEDMLRSQAETLGALMAERAVLKSTDPEIVRLSALADRALSEGALATAIALHAQAKQRVTELETDVATVEDDALARRREFADVYARSAEANSLAFDHLAAAADYARAFEQVDRRDDRLAWTYKREQMRSLSQQGRFRGDRAAYEQALVAGDEALRLADYIGDPQLRMNTRIVIGRTLRRLGEREPGTESLDRAATILRETVAMADKAKDPLIWGDIQQTLGETLVRIGERGSDPAPLEESVRAFEEALSVRSPETSPDLWAESQHVLGAALATLGAREQDTVKLERSVRAFEAALTVRKPETEPLDWSNTLSALGASYAILGERSADKALIQRAVDVFREALTVIAQDRMPLEWADLQSNLGVALIRTGELTGERPPVDEAIGAFRKALTELTFERGAAAWAETQNNLGAALSWLGNKTEDIDFYRQSVEAYRAAQKVQTFEAMPVAWALSQYNVGTTTGMIGRVTRDVATLKESVAAHTNALKVYSRAQMPREWMRTHYELGRTLFSLARLTDDRAIAQQAIAAFEESLRDVTPEIARHQWGTSHKYMAEIHMGFAGTDQSAEEARKAIAAYKAVFQGANIEKYWGDMIEAHSSLAQAYLRLGLIEGNADAMRQARAEYEKAMALTNRAADPEGWVNTKDGLAGVVAELGILTRNGNDIAEARRIVAEVWDFVRENGVDKYDTYFRDRLAVIDRHLSDVR